MSALRAVRSSAFRSPPSALKTSIVVQVANEQRRLPVAASRLRSAIKTVLAGEGFDRADISLAVVDDAAIHEINRRYLQHDEPTDVISFVLDQDDGFVDGEIVVSADTAATAGKQIGWSAADELLLYVIHGTLHLAGYDDLVPTAKRKMRERERFYLTQLGVALPKNTAAKPKSTFSRSQKTRKSQPARSAKSQRGATRR
jgi:probable rRNA maturation factor